MKKNILHIGNGDKFISSFIEFVKEYFDFNENQFYMKGVMAEKEINSYPNVKVGKKGKANLIKEYSQLIIPMHQSRKIIMHGLFNWPIVAMLFFMPWLLKKCYWVMWGGDLYVHKSGVKKWKWKLRNFRRPGIKNMGHVVTDIPGNLGRARQWYGAKGEYHECLMALSNVVDSVVIQAAQD